VKEGDFADWKEMRVLLASTSQISSI